MLLASFYSNDNFITISKLENLQNLKQLLNLETCPLHYQTSHTLVSISGKTISKKMVFNNIYMLQHFYAIFTTAIIMHR